MTELVLATGNKGKIEEFQALLGDMDITVRSMKEFSGIGPIVEKGASFEENALIKARAVCRATGKPAMADDSGLVVDALNGAPGIYSARYAGEPCDDAANNEKLLREMEGIPEEKRTGGFYCAIALVFPDGTEEVMNGYCPGVILESARGNGGFGYDPVFYVPQFAKTFGELSMEEKNSISHRGIANRKAVEVLARRMTVK